MECRSITGTAHGFTNKWPQDVSANLASGPTTQLPYGKRIPVIRLFYVELVP